MNFQPLTLMQPQLLKRNRNLKPLALRSMESLSTEGGSLASELTAQWTLKRQTRGPDEGQIGTAALPGLLWEAIVSPHVTDSSARSLLLTCDGSPG